MDLMKSIDIKDLINLLFPVPKDVSEFDFNQVRNLVNRFLTLYK